MQEMWVRSLGWEDPLEEGMATHSSILPGKFHGQRSLAGYSPWGLKELDTAEHKTQQQQTKYLLVNFLPSFLLSLFHFYPFFLS